MGKKILLFLTSSIFYCTVQYEHVRCFGLCKLKYSYSIKYIGLPKSYIAFGTKYSLLTLHVLYIYICDFTRSISRLIACVMKSWNSDFNTWGLFSDSFKTFLRITKLLLASLWKEEDESFLNSFFLKECQD